MPMMHGISYSVAVFPLIKNKKEIRDLAKKVQKKLLNNRIASFYDETGSIGKRYRRQDELGTPFCITIDYESLEDQSVTIRYRDTMEQVRLKINKIPDIISRNLISI